MKPRRRTILKVIALLAAGAAVNVAVAWGLAWQTDLRMSPIIEGGRWNGPVFCRARLDFIGRGKRVEVSHYRQPPFRQEEFAVTGDDPRIFVPTWCGFVPPTTGVVEGQHASECRIGYAHGWPALSVWRLVQHSFINMPDAMASEHMVDDGIALGNSTPNWRNRCPSNSCHLARLRDQHAVLCGCPPAVDCSPRCTAASSPH